MKNFEFPLQRAADWYRQKRSLEEAELSRIQGKLRDIENQSQLLQSIRRDEKARIQQSATLTGRELEVFAGYERKVEEELARLNIGIVRLRKEFATQQARVASCHRRVRMMEELEQTRRDEWLKESDREQEALASELFLASLSRVSADSMATENPGN